MNITAAQVNELRQMTGAGMMDCKKALVECNGDKQAAIDFLRKKGQKIAEKRADHDAAEGCVLSKVTADHAFGAVVMLNCETDFVAATEDFVNRTKAILDYAIENKIADKDSLMAGTMEGRPMSEYITELTGKTGEKVQIGKYFAINAAYVTNYNHPGNRRACIVGMNKTFGNVEEIAHEVALQITAMSPIAIDENDVPQEVKDRELAIAIEKTKEEQVSKAVESAVRKAGLNPNHFDSEDHIESNKAKGWISDEDIAKFREVKEKTSAEKLATLPEAMIQNIAKGRMAKFYKTNTLLNQDSLIFEGHSVKEYITNADKTATVVAFNRVELGA